MRVQILSDDPSWAEKYRRELEGEGHEVLEGRGLRLDVSVVDGRVKNLEMAIMRAAATGHFVILLGSLDVISECPDGVDEIGVEPLEPGELAARVELLDRLRRRTSREKVLAAAIEKSGDVVEICDADWRILFVNPAYEDVFGIPIMETLGRKPAELTRSMFHPAEFWEELDQTLAAKQPWHGVIVSQARDGRLVYFDVSIAPIFDAEGELINYVTVRRDITSRMRAEEELRRANEDLEAARDGALAANKAKSQFLANMSHELRTPLNAIIGYSEMLSEEAEMDGQQELVADLKKIRSAGQHLLGLINDVLDLSKIEAGKMELYMESFSLRNTVDAVEDTMRPLFGERGNELVVEVDDGVGAMHADLTKVRQTLLNLLSNANKFTERGRVWLRVRAEEGWVRIQVQDQGIGMSTEQIDRLFQPFTQADASTTRQYGGTGLGLAISQRFCEMMGGRISVQSELGKGSTFTVRLPIEGRGSDTRGSAFPEGATHSVLLIDDDESVHDLIARSLGRRGFRVEGMRSGEGAVEMARTLRPDVILLDVMMPGTDGWEVLAALKADPITQDIPVVMHTMVHQQGIGYALGAVDYLIKPVEPQRLVQVLRTHIDGGSTEVLVVEDDADSRELMRRTLQDAGYRVVEANDGGEAIEILGARSPALIVLDLMMPNIDGFGVLAHLRSKPRLAGIPVVVVTAKVLTPMEREELRGAARRVIQKGEHSRQELLQLLTQKVGDAVRRSRGGGGSLPPPAQS